MNLPIKKIIRNLRVMAKPASTALWRLRLPRNKPVVLQIPITHACDSRCSMCGIGASQNEARDINAEELGRILGDPIFDQVTGIGFNGGEPTLRDDLIPLLEQCVQKLPKLQTVNLITNGIQKDRIFRIVTGIDAFLKKAGKSFNVSVSIDGVGRFHDLNRGVDGNFDSAVSLMKDLLGAGVYVWAGTTLTPVTLYCADDLITLFEEMALPYYEFRLAVPIRRLAIPTKAMPVYNLLSYLKFNPDQLFQATQFFHRLAETDYGKGGKDTYLSIYRHLAFGESRSAGCMWKSNGLTLDAAGDVSWCSVESPIIGSALTTPTSELWRTGQPAREKILKEKCDTCMHDLSGPITIGQAIKTTREEWTRRAGNYRMNSALRSAKRAKAPARERPPVPMRDLRKVIITGWWGTETHGDKAIIGELIHFLNVNCPNLTSIVVTSFPGFEYVVEKTIVELRETGCCDVSTYGGTVSIHDFHETGAFKDCDGVFIGGGPMEEIRETLYIQRAFTEAANTGKQAVVFGCGIDPHLGTLEPVVANLLEAASCGFFRDPESLASAARLCGEEVLKKFSSACDPAIRFVIRWQEKHNAHANPREGLALLLRENTPEYVHGDAVAALESRNHELSNAVGKFLGAEASLTVKFLAMNCHWIGKDDRLLNRKIIRTLPDSAADRLKTYNHKYMSLQSLLKNLSGSEFVFAMRYHGHLFSFALGIPFLSIDYTGKDNKVSNFLRKAGLQRFSIPWDGKMGAEDFAGVFGDLREKGEAARTQIALKRVELSQSLEGNYRRLVGEF